MRFENVQGSIVAMITPFHEDGSVNFEVLEQLLERQIAAGTDGILTLGTTGEYPTMTHEEDAAVVERTIEVVNGRVPVMVGSGSNCTATQIEKSIQYQDMGADALLLIAPYYNKANPEGMYRHFAETADKVKIPCILYNVPGRTGCSIPVSVVEKLAQHPNIAAIKEANSDISKIVETFALVGDQLDIYSGNDDQIVPILSMGGQGCISVLSNVVPRETVAITDQFFAGNVAEAARLQCQFMPLIRSLFCESNPIPVKAAMSALGFCENYLRLPLVPMEQDHYETMLQRMRELGLQV